MITEPSPSLTTFPETNVTGVSVRTNNAFEMSAESGHIAALWHRFGRTIAPQLNQGSQVFGVYSNYESDHNGDFSVLAGSDQGHIVPEADFVSHIVPSGHYLMFTAKGALPDAIVKTWQQVWSYFQSSDCPYQRAYTTDFEFYKAKDSAELYIAVKQ